MMDAQIVFYTVGFLIFLLGLANLIKAIGRRSWPETVGKIIRNDVSEIHYSSGGLSTGQVSAFSTKSMYGTDKEIFLRLRYVYVLDGYKYIGSNLYSAPLIRSRKSIGGLKEGDKIKVFYNVKNPQLSFLAHSYAWPSIAMLTVGLCVSAYGYYIG